MGRRIKTVEEKRHAAIDKAWQIVTDYLNDENVSVKEKIEVATKVAVKDMPSSPLIDQSQHYHVTYAYRTPNSALRDATRASQPT